MKSLLSRSVLVFEGVVDPGAEWYLAPLHTPFFIEPATWSTTDLSASWTQMLGNAQLYWDTSRPISGLAEVIVRGPVTLQPRGTGVWSTLRATGVL